MHMSILSNINSLDRVLLLVSLPFAACGYALELLGSYFLPVLGATGDWPKLISLYFGMRNSAEVTLRDGQRINVTKQSMRVFLRRIKESKEKAKGQEPKNLGYYAPLGVRGKTVVDVGAYTADTAMYFVKRGARRVIGFEPVRGSYEMGVRNVKAAHMGSRIIMVNKAISLSRGRGSDRFGKSFSLGLDPKKETGRISLGQAIKKYALRGAVLKLDSEGSEYGILHSLSKEDAEAFDEMAVRYYRGYRNIVSKLRSLGYETTCTKPAYLFADMFRTLQARGMIYARR